HFQNGSITHGLQKCVELIAGAHNLDDVQRAGDIHDLATKNIHAAFDFGALGAGGFNLDQHQFTLDVRAFGQVYQLDHVNQFIEVLGNLLDLVIITQGGQR